MLISSMWRVYCRSVRGMQAEWVHLDHYHLQQKGCTSVELKAMGQAINKTVTIGEE